MFPTGKYTKQPKSLLWAIWTLDVPGFVCLLADYAKLDTESKCSLSTNPTTYGKA